MSLKDFKIIILSVFIYLMVANRLGIPSMTIGEVVYKYNTYIMIYTSKIVLEVYFVNLQK